MFVAAPAGEEIRLLNSSRAVRSTVYLLFENTALCGPAVVGAVNTDAFVAFKKPLEFVTLTEIVGMPPPEILHPQLYVFVAFLLQAMLVAGFVVTFVMLVVPVSYIGKLNSSCAVISTVNWPYEVFWFCALLFVGGV